MKEKLVLGVLCALLCFPSFVWASDSSSPENPILIRSINDLVKISEVTASGTLYYQFAKDLQVDESFSEGIVAVINEGYDIVIDGNGHTLSAYITGTNSQGITQTNGSNYSMFSVPSGAILTLNNLTIHGGSRSAVVNTGTLRMQDCQISQSGSSSAIGGGLNNGSLAIAILQNTRITRNVADYGGGFLNRGTLIFENCLVSENRNIGGGSRGGGGGENQGILYACNTVISNNQSTEIGGGINNCRGTLYLINSSVTGNITQNHTQAHYGGGIGMNSGSLYMANCIVKNNYAPTSSGFTASDIGIYSGNVSSYTLINNIYGEIVNSGGSLGEVSGNTQNDTDDIFNKYQEVEIYTASGGISKTLTGMYRPALIEGVPILSASSGVAIAGGIDVYFDYTGLDAIKMGYQGESGIVKLTATAPDVESRVSNYIDGNNRATPNTVVGCAGPSATTYYKVQVLNAGNGWIEGGSIFGDYYTAGTSVTLKAVPTTIGYILDGFYIDGMKVSSTSPYTFIVNKDVEIQAEFTPPLEKSDDDKDDTSVITITVDDDGKFLYSEDDGETQEEFSGTIIGEFDRLTLNTQTPVMLVDAVIAELVIGDEVSLFIGNDVALGTISGEGNITITGGTADKLTLTEANTNFEGTLTLDGPTLKIEDAEALGEGTLVCINGEIEIGEDLNVANAIELQNDLTLSVSSEKEVILSGNITGNEQSFIKSGEGTLTLAGEVNTETLYVEEGVLIISENGKLREETDTEPATTIKIGAEGEFVDQSATVREVIILDGYLKVGDINEANLLLDIVVEYTVDIEPGINWEKWNEKEEKWEEFLSISRAEISDQIRVFEDGLYRAWVGFKNNSVLYSEPIEVKQSVADRYHTITLEVAPGIDLEGITPGNHSVKEGEHLHLQFKAEAAEGVILWVDGVETSFNDFGADRYYSYILNSVEKDHSIRITLKQYSVTLPVVGGATLDVGPGDHRVGYDQPFTFILFLDPGIAPEAIKVYANETEMKPEISSGTTLRYTIDRVTGPIQVTIKGLNPTSNMRPDDVVRIYTADNRLWIETNRPQSIQVYSLNGKCIVTQQVNGQAIVTLQPGVYAVKTPAEVIKVIIP